MMLAMLALIQAAAAPAAFDYILIDDGRTPSAAVLTPALAAAAPGARPASLASPSACARSLDDHRARCIRALLPDDGTTIAFAIDAQTISNHTGTVVTQRHSIRCIGARGVGHAAFPGAIDRADPQAIAARLPACIAAARAAPGDWGGGLRDGIWHFPLRADALAADNAQARGWSAERAFAEVEEAHTTHRNDGRCRLSGRIVYVEAGRRLRAGDRFTVEAPCRWQGEDRASGMFTQGMVPGWTVRISVRSDDGAVGFVEAL